MSLTVKENNNATVLAVVRDGFGNIQNITGWTFVFRVVTIAGVTLFEKNSAGGSSQVSITDATNGKVSIFILPADTKAKAGSYQFELKGTDAAANQYTLSGPAEFIISVTLI